jgi:hypothetical protein
MFLVRRFTVICMISAVFGLAFAMVVERANRPERSWEIGSVTPCTFNSGFKCLPPVTR